MNVEFLKPAQAELAEAITYYNAQKEWLGFEFAEKVKETIKRIIQYPKAWSLISHRTRRCRTKEDAYY